MERINVFTEGYEQGYFKALLHFRKEIEQNRHMQLWLRTKKAYENYVSSALKLLTENRLIRERAMKLGVGQAFEDFNVIVTPKGVCVYESE